MTQYYQDIAETDTLKDSREVINRRDEALKSNNSGTAFPTTDLIIGMTCYRTDEALKGLYVLSQITPSVVWRRIPDGNPVDVSLGGTGAQTASDARNNLGLGSCAVESVLPVNKGGTSGTTQATARTGIGINLDVTNAVLPVSSGGTGQNTLAEFRQLLNIPEGNVAVGNYDVLPVSVGGTGSTTASGARNNLGLGTASQYNVGSGASNVVVLDSQGKVPNSYIRYYQENYVLKWSGSTTGSINLASSWGYGSYVYVISQYNYVTGGRAYNSVYRYCDSLTVNTISGSYNPGNAPDTSVYLTRIYKLE